MFATLWESVSCNQLVRWCMESFSPPPTHRICSTPNRPLPCGQRVLKIKICPLVLFIAPAAFTSCMTRLIHASACHLDKEVLLGGGGGRGVCKKIEAWPKVLVKVLATHMETVLCCLVWCLCCFVWCLCCSVW